MLYSVIGELPVSEALESAVQLNVMEVISPKDFEGTVIAEGTLRILAPEVFTLEAWPCPMLLMPDTLTATRLSKARLNEPLERSSIGTTQVREVNIAFCAPLQLV